jgi:integrase
MAKFQHFWRLHSSKCSLNVPLVSNHGAYWVLTGKSGKLDMGKVKITKRSVDAIASGVSDVYLWDDELRGFGLKVTPSGSKTYLFQYRLGGRAGRTRRYTIGKHGSPWLPAGARIEAEKLALKVKQGIDPYAEQAEAAHKAVSLAFDKYVDLFEERYVTQKWKSSPRDAVATLRNYAVPVLRNKALSSIKRSDLARVLDSVPASRPATRRKLFAMLRKMMKWAVSRGDLEPHENPVLGVEVPPPVKSRDRVLTDIELRWVWNASKIIGYPFGPLTRVLILSGQRREEVASMPWDELDRSRAEWFLPAARSKNGKGHVVSLSPEAILELDGLAGGEEWPVAGLVFSTTGTTSVSGFTKAKRRLDAEVNSFMRQETGVEADRCVEHWRIHDLRRTVATGLQRLGVRFEVTEAVLNHISGAQSGIAGVYQRYDWKSEKREALLAWGAFVASVVSEKNHPQS